MDTEVISLVIAFIALFVWPLISYIIANKQIGMTLQITKNQIFSPLKEEEIKYFRKLIAKLLWISNHLYVARDENTEGTIHEEIEFLYYEIEMFLNFNNKIENELNKHLKRLVFKIDYEKDENSFIESHSCVNKLAKNVIEKWKESMFNDK